MRDLTVGKEGKLILNFAGPMLIGSVFQQFYNIVDSIVVGNFVGKEALAAVGASFPVIFVMVSLIIGLVSGTTIVISQYFGAKDMVSVKKAIDTMYIYSFFSAIVVSVVGIFFSESILKLLQLPPEILPMATSYLRIIMAGIIVFFAFNGINAVLRGLGDSRTPLYFLIAATLLNVVLDLLFVIVFDMGVEGVAIATIASNGVVFLAAAYHLNRTHKVIRVAIRGLIFDLEIFKQSFRIGLPTGLQQTFVALGIMALMGIVNTFGTNVIAAFSVASRIDAIATIPAMVFGQALATFVGQNLGANKPGRVKSGLRATVIMTTAVTIVTSGIIIFFGHFLISAFTRDAEVIRIGDEYLTIVSSFYMLIVLMFIYGGVMRGAGDTLIPMFFSLISLWLIRIPLALILSKHFGASGIWWAIPSGWLVGLILYFAYYKTGRWKKMSVVKFDEG